MAEPTLFPNDEEAKKERKRESVRRWRAKYPGREMELRRKNWERIKDRVRESRRKSQQKRYYANLEESRAKNREFQKQYYAEKSPHILEVQRKRRLRNIDRVRALDRDNHFKYHYGITRQQRDEMLAAQGGLCAICGVDNPGNKRGWHVDHCHETKKVRSILCHHCNVALGQAKENPEVLRKMADYIERHKSK